MREPSSPTPATTGTVAGPSRREVGGLLGRALGAAGLLLAGLASWRFAAWSPPPPEPVSFPPLEGPPRRGPLVRQQGRVLLVQHGERAWALSAACSHLGCTVAPGPDGRTLDCPCHGSRYALDGGVLHGPADEPLTELAVEPDGAGGFVVRPG